MPRSPTMPMPASPPRSAPAALAAVLAPLAARADRCWRVGCRALPPLVLALLVALLAAGAHAQQRGGQAPPQRGSGPLGVAIAPAPLTPIPRTLPELAR